MTRLSLIITCLVFAAGASAQPPKPATGAAALEGSWVVASINGQTAPEGSPAMTLTFTGDKYEQALGAEVNERGSFKVDATKKPMTIDLSITEGSDAGSTQLGVFEVTGDTMRLHLDTPGANQRPADFTMKDGAFLVVAKKKG